MNAERRLGVGLDVMSMSGSASRCVLRCSISHDNLAADDLGEGKEARGQ